MRLALVQISFGSDRNSNNEEYQKAREQKIDRLDLLELFIAINKYMAYRMRLYEHSE